VYADLLNGALPLLDRFRETTVAVAGDLVADVYVRCRPVRLSREAPVMIVEWESEETIPGSAANTIHNLATLGVKTVAVGVVGDDKAGNAIVAQLARFPNVDTSGILVVPGHHTITKTRYLGADRTRTPQQLLRVDKSQPIPITPSLQAELLSRIDSLRDTAGAWMISDYGGGVAAGAMRERLLSFAPHRPVITDSRYELGAFVGTTIATPNDDEAAQASALPVQSPEQAIAAGTALMERLRAAAILVTRGNQGATLVQRGAEPVHIPVYGSDQAVDVSGAGDTVSAVVAASLASGGSYRTASALANIAAGITVKHKGATPNVENAQRAAVTHNVKGVNQ
jgi:rfaE bifunctional protein kinase chain/domain